MEHVKLHLVVEGRYLDFWHETNRKPREALDAMTPPCPFTYVVRIGTGLRWVMVFPIFLHFQVFFLLHVTKGWKQRSPDGRIRQ